MGRPKLRGWLQREQRSKSSRVILTLVLTIGLGGCMKPEVHVDIEDEQSRAKYVELLEAHNLGYTVDGEGVIHVHASPDELSPVRDEYCRWQERKFQSEGVQILDDCESR